MFLNYFSLFLFALKPGSCLNRTQTHKLTVPQQVTWKEGKSDQEAEHHRRPIWAYGSAAMGFRLLNPQTTDITERIRPRL